MATIAYHDGRSVDENDLGLTLLEVSLKHGIPHVHACGGHAACSTCRVMIHRGLENVQPRNPAETRLAALKGFEPDVRIACQTKITGPVCIRRLVLDECDATIAQAEKGMTSGRET